MPVGASAWFETRRRGAGTADIAMASSRSTSGRWVLLPGMVDLHAHLPQLPNAGLGAGMDLLSWLDRYIFPLERRFDAAGDATRLAPAAFRAFAAAGTTTLLAYGAVYKASMDGAFRAAEAHGIRAILGKVMMDRITYDETIDPSTILERSVRESAELIEAWHGADDGRLGYAVTPRFAVSCTADMLARVGRAGCANRRVVADARVRGSRRDRRGRAALPRGDGLRRRLRPRRRARAADDPRPRRAPLGSRAGAAGRDRRRASPTARPRTCSSRPGSCRSRATSRRGSGSGSDRTSRAGRTRRSSRSCASGATRRRRFEPSPARSASRLAPLDWLRTRDARRRARPRPGGSHRLASRRARRPTSSRSTRG